MLHTKKIRENFTAMCSTIHSNTPLNTRMTSRPINVYTDSSCCSQKQIAKCETYGRTGVCDYDKNDKSCMCQDGF